MEVISNDTSFLQWLIKYRLYHIPFWIVYHCMWWAIAVGSISEVANNIIIFSPYSIKSAFYVIFQALCVYFNLYFLIPKYLQNGRYILYIFLLVLTIILSAAFIASGYYVSAGLSGKSVISLYGASSNFMYFFKTNTLLSTVASTTLAMSVKLTKNWIQAQRREQLLRTEKLETELNFLKYQFNPHFLFNTINSIFFLIHKNPDMASACLAKFSDLLRHQLYEDNNKLIALSREMLYLENFIELEKLRQSNNLLIELEIDDHQIPNLGISPFILMTFVENAFKHVSSDDDQQNWIKIKISSTGHQLFFSIVNSTSGSVVQSVMSYSGIGLQNVRRRLDLLYPKKYGLNMQNGNSRFEVNLRLPLSEVIPVQSHTSK